MNITPEMISALATLRLHRENDVDLGRAIDVLDNADVFAAIDEAANEVETAAQFAAVDPEEWGDTTRADMARHQEG